MKINRRDITLRKWVVLACGHARFRAERRAPRAQSQLPVVRSRQLLEALQRNRLPLAMSEGPAGRGWD